MMICNDITAHEQMAQSPSLLTDSLAIEYNNIDHVHSELFILIAQCCGLTEEMPPDTTLEIMRDLIDQFRRHFAQEEQIIYRSKYKRTSDHVVQHWKFIQRTSAMIQAYQRGNRGVITEFRDYVDEWLSDHSSVDDREFDEFLQGHVLS